MSKEGFTHEETASAQYATPFVENPELERRLVRRQMGCQRLTSLQDTLES